MKKVMVNFIWVLVVSYMSVGDYHTIFFNQEFSTYEKCNVVKNDLLREFGANAYRQVIKCYEK